MSLQTVDEFLAKHLSLGPHEDAAGGATEFVSYDEADLDIRVLLALARQRNKLSHVVCLPEFETCLNDLTFRIRFDSPSCTGKRIRAGIAATGILSRSSARLWVPSSLEGHLQKCRKRFVVCNFGIYASDSLDTGHANALIFDTSARIIERYEPLGRLKDAADAHLKRMFAQVLPSWTYVGTTMAASAHGAQRRVTDSFKGLCVTFSLYYVLMRLLNPNVPARTLNHFLASMDDHQMRDEILRLNRFAADTLRKFPRGRLARHGTTPLSRNSPALSCFSVTPGAQRRKDSFLANKKGASPRW